MKKEKTNDEHDQRFTIPTFIRLNGQFNENNLTDSLNLMRIQLNIYTHHLGYMKHIDRIKR